MFCPECGTWNRAADLAKHTVRGRPLVIKVLHRTSAQDPEMRECFRREAEAAARFIHPFISASADMGTARDIEYVAMPHNAGGALADRLMRRKTVPAYAAVSVAVQVAGALDYSGVPPEGRRRSRRSWL